MEMVAGREGGGGNDVGKSRQKGEVDEKGGERMERVGKKEREGRENDMVWWVYEILDRCHLISGALVVLDVLHWM